MKRNFVNLLLFLAAAEQSLSYPADSHPLLVDPNGQPSQHVSQKMEKSGEQELLSYEEDYYDYTANETDSLESGEYHNQADNPIDNQSTCEDRFPDCKSLAQDGYCHKNPNWMTVNCPQSCDKCSRPCEDLKQDCRDWAKSNLCSSSATEDYMKQYCPKSCDICT